jgi:dihydroorotase
MTVLVEKGLLSPSDMVKKMSVEPNRIMGLTGGTLSSGAIADITIIDPDANWKVNPEHFFSKSRNTAFSGFSLKGYAWMTILDGHIVFRREG